jgi:hypothetical protein
MDAIGGGVLVAVAAALWVAYLLPTWFRRGQYLATERNAVRLQQTLRILAETAETPAEVRVEATAREVAAQQRILAERTERARLESEAAAQLAIAERVAAEQKAAAARAVAERAAAERAAAERAASSALRSVTDASAAHRALRRSRGLCSLGMLVSLVVVIVGLIGLPMGGSPVIAVVGAAGVVVAFGGVAVLARRRVPVASIVVEAPRVEVAPFVPIDLPEPVAEPVTGWTPQPLPKPLHLSRGTIAAAAMASVEAAERLRRAGIEAELAERAAKLEPELPKLTPRQAPAPAPAARTAGNPYAGMGVVADAQPGFESLDAVLQRRRHAG